MAIFQEVKMRCTVSMLVTPQRVFAQVVSWTTFLWSANNDMIDSIRIGVLIWNIDIIVLKKIFCQKLFVIFDKWEIGSSNDLREDWSFSVQILAMYHDWFHDLFDRMPRDGRELQWRLLCEGDCPEMASKFRLPDNADENYTPLQRLLVVR